MTAAMNAAVARAEHDEEAASRLCTACERMLAVDGAAVTLVAQGATRGTVGASNDASRRLEELQFTFGEGPCIEASASGRPVLVPDLAMSGQTRWPLFSDAVLSEGVRGVFAVPIVFATVTIGALDLFRRRAEPLSDLQLLGAMTAARLATRPLLNLLDQGIDHADAADPGALAADTASQGRAGAYEIDRIEVYQATGMLIAQLDVDAADAVVRLRAHAIMTGRTASQVAFAIIGGDLRLERDDAGGLGDTGADG